MAGSISGTERIRRTVVLLAALAKHAEKYAKLHDGRDLLKVGATPVAAEIRGIVGRAKIELDIAGTLSVAPNGTQTKNYKPDHVAVVAAMLAALPTDAERARVLAEADAKLDAVDQLPEQLTAMAAALISKRTIPKTSDRAGNVSFAALEQQAAAAA